MEAKVATFSIVAYDPETEELGIAVQSKFLASGAVVPWAKAGVGAIATQARANTSYGPEGLNYLAEGNSPEQVIELLTEKDEGAEERQVGIVDAQGRSASFTGEDCIPWAGAKNGENYSIQGNILTGEETIKAMEESFLNTEGELAERLVASLKAGQKAGGDRRGKQSAALLVVKEEGGYGGFNDRYIDLRVDEHQNPIEELERILDIFYLYFGEEDSELVEIKGDQAAEIKTYLSFLGHYEGNIDGNFDQRLEEALENFYYTENFEERKAEKGYIPADILDFMKQKVRQQNSKWGRKK